MTTREAAPAKELTRWTRSTAIRAGLVLRARIVLAAAAGEANEAIAERLGTSRTTVVKWRGRYQAKGVAGLVLATCSDQGLLILAQTGGLRR